MEEPLKKNFQKKYIKAADFIDLKLTILQREECTEEDVVDLLEGIGEVSAINKVVKLFVLSENVEILF